MILAFDCDGVLADFNSAYGALIVKVSGEDRFPGGWKDDPNYPSTWFWEREAGYTKEVENKVWREHILKEGVFWTSLKPYEPETLKRIGKLSLTHDVYFVTHRMGKKAKQQTEEWLYKHGMVNYPTVICVKESTDKLAILQAIGAEAFIDDKPETCNDTALGRYGMKTYVLDQPWNRGKTNGKVLRVPSVQAMLEDLKLWT